jgi:hypothetical protein
MCSFDCSDEIAFIQNAAQVTVDFIFRTITVFMLMHLVLLTFAVLFVILGPDEDLGEPEKGWKLKLFASNLRIAAAIVAIHMPYTRIVRDFAPRRPTR